MIDAVLRQIELAQGFIFEQVVEPVMFQLGLMEYVDDCFDGVQLAIFGALEIGLAFLLFRPLELWRPVERWGDRRAVRTDVIYTLVSRLGFVPLILFLTLGTLGVLIERYLVFDGYIGLNLEQIVPALAGLPLVTLMLYVVILDLAEYWRHRLQHWCSWWWALHSLHHDQRQMTLWTDDRNHILDDVLSQVWRGAIALLIGVPPSEFPLLLVAFRLVESLSHTNVRLGFGRFGGAVLVGPEYHRAHHAIEHAAPPFDRARGCNFAVIFPAWDIVFGTWRRRGESAGTGVAGIPEAVSRRGYLRHQLDGFRRLGRALRRYLDRRNPRYGAPLGAD